MIRIGRFVEKRTMDGLDSCKEGKFFAKNRKSESGFLMQRARAIMTILYLDYPDGQYLKKYDENHLIPRKNINASGVFRDISGQRIQWVEG